MIPAMPSCRKDAAGISLTSVDNRKFSTSGTNRQGMILYARPLHLHLARILAKARQRGHDHCRKPHEDIGPKRNKRAEAYGILAELLIIEALEAAGMNPTGYYLLDDKPHPGPDFWLNGISFDVKAIPFKSGFLCVNEGQRLAPEHQVDFVLPVAFPRPNIAHIFAPINYEEVACWPLRQGHSPYRSISIEVLKPLTSFAQLEGGRP